MSDLTNWVDEEEVDFASIFAAAPGTITPYTLDVARKRVIFVRRDEGRVFLRDRG